MFARVVCFVRRSVAAFRQEGVATIVLGCTPYGIGAADEYVELDEQDEVLNLAKMHALIAEGYLQEER